MTNIYFDAKHNDRLRCQNLYDGAIYIYSPTSAGKTLCEFAAEFCLQKFGCHPPTAQHEIGVEQYVEILKTLKPEFIHHPECKRLIPRLLHELGCDNENTYFDVPRIRTACAGDYLTSGLAYAFKPHRDTWYSTPMCQLNWWLPVFPIEAENGMEFYFDYFDQPIQNSSYEFNYQDWNNMGRVQAHNQGKVDKRVQSEALEDLNLDNATRIVCEPGGLILFSAAHLHGTVANTTDVTRISIDFRTVNRLDLNGGAENVDSESTGTTMMDYLQLSSLEHFGEELVEEMKNKIPEPNYSTKQKLSLESHQ